MKLHTESIPGNLFNATTIINKRGWADYLVSMDFTGDFTGGYTITVFRMPDDAVHEVRRRDPAYVSDVHHDDVLEIKK